MQEPLRNLAAGAQQSYLTARGLRAVSRKSTARDSSTWYAVSTVPLSRSDGPAHANRSRTRPVRWSVQDTLQRRQEALVAAFEEQRSGHTTLDAYLQENLKVRAAKGGAQPW